SRRRSSASAKADHELAARLVPGPARQGLGRDHVVWYWGVRRPSSVLRQRARVVRQRRLGAGGRRGVAGPGPTGPARPRPGAPGATAWTDGARRRRGAPGETEGRGPAG